MATRDAIKRNVLSKIDEISPFQETDEQFDLLMESMLNDCANRYLSLLPIHLIVPVKLTLSVNPPNLNFERGVANYHDLGIVYLPTDFLRIAYVNCLEWRRVVNANDCKTPADAQYNRQFNFHTRAGVAKPMAFVDTENVKGKRLIISPFRDDWGINILTILYVPKTLPENMQNDLLDGFYWFFASYILTSMQRPDFAKVAMEKFGEFLVNKQ
jgi:hypothetical protein